MDDFMQTSFDEIIRGFNQYKDTGGVTLVSGGTDGQWAPLISTVAETGQGNQILVITDSYEKARAMEESISFFSSKRIVVLPEEEYSLYKYEARSRISLNQRMEAIDALVRGEDVIIIGSIMAALKKMETLSKFTEKVFQINIGEKLDLEEVRSNLAEMGYQRVGMVEAKGQYSIRGGILDIFTIDAEYPYRIELFDIEVDGLRTFDPLSQRAIENINQVTVFPCGDSTLSDDRKTEEKTAYIWSYMKDGGILAIDSWDRVLERLNLEHREWQGRVVHAMEDGKLHGRVDDEFGTSEDLIAAVSQRPTFVFTSFKKQLKEIDRLNNVFSLNVTEGSVFNGRMDFLSEEINRLYKNGYHTVIACTTEDRLKSLNDFLRRSELVGKAELKLGYLPKGMIFGEQKLAFISDNDIFVIRKKRKKRTSSHKSKPIKTFTDIKKGDYVVHENHGIGKFMGVEQLDIQGIKKDYLKIQYADQDALYIPVEQMDMIQSYIGSAAGNPKISRLSSGEWKKTKAKAKAAIANMAEELVRLSAERSMAPGYSFGGDTVWQREFEAMFPYEETENQLRCIDEIKMDMEFPAPMDRLLCGDVGYGKTEVAARAIFKCVMEGKQAAVLVPTTILASQHYQTFKERFERFPCKVEMLSRFRSEEQQAKIISQLEKGSVDVIIGTHRLLSKDIKFKDLGLLVIDEEQRFGVQHKEAIKHLRKNIDVLAISATPIPRTLHMSLAGIRNMSLLEEPPEERYPVQTFVLEQDEQIIREVIYRELSRGGQVFLIYNRVRGIQQIGDYVRSLVPEANVAVAHGQMNEHMLEDIMSDFVDGEYNVLVATTIIESGIDIPNANTLIILDADRFGLSQLYQLKGRVGRSTRIAYAYFMYQKDKVLTEVAEKRLRAIKEFTEFGAGFRIAMRDLEIRGAGNLLGVEQSGHMMTIGYELYCKLIDQAVRSLKGQSVQTEERDVVIELKINAYIPEDYIADETMKLEMYKKIAEIQDDQDMSEVMDELSDRFGEPPKETVSLINVAYTKGISKKLGISEILSEKGKVVFRFYEENKLSAERIAALTEKYGMRLTLNLGKKPFIKLMIKESKLVLREIMEFIQILNDKGKTE